MSSRRSANFTHHEKEILLSLMQTYRHVVEDKRTDGIMVKEKNAAWIELTNKYNAQNEVWTRSVKQLRQCWKNLKSRARIDLMRVNLQTSTSDSDPNSVRLKLVPLNNVSKPTDNSNQSTLNSSNNNNNNNTTGNIINNNNNNNINNANNNNATNIILSSILNNNNNNINNSNTIKSGSVPSYGSRLQALSSTTGSNSVVGLSPSLLSSGGLSNRPNSKTSGSKKRKKKKVVLNDVSSRNFATNDNNSNSNNSTSSSRRQQRLLTVASATIGVERDDIDDEDDVDDDDEEDDAVAVLAADNDDDSNTIGARRRRRRRLHPTSKSTSIGDSALLDVVADENDEFEDDENEEEEEEEEEEEDEDEEGDDNDEDDDDDIDDSGTDDDVRRSSRQHRSGVNVDSFQVEQNSDPSSQGVGGPSGTAQDVDPLYTIENLAVVSVSGSADRIHFQHHANSPTSDLQNQTDGNLLHSHHPHQLHQSQHHQQQPPHLHSQVNNYHHSNRLSADSITRLDDNFSTTEPDIKVFDSIRGFGKVLHTQPSFANQIVNNNSLNFTPSINYTSDINSLNGVAGSSQSGPLIVSAHSENGGQLPSIEPVLVEKVNDHDMLLDDLRKTEHAEKMKNIRLERRLISVEHKARMGLIKLKSDYIKLKMDFLLQNKR